MSLFSFCAGFDLTITNIRFKMKSCSVNCADMPTQDDPFPDDAYGIAQDIAKKLGEISVRLLRFRKTRHQHWFDENN